MPIEIREIVIKTEVRESNPMLQSAQQQEQFIQLKRELLLECKNIVATQLKKRKNKR